MLGRVDALVCSAEIGVNSAVIRERVCDGLEGVGIRIDPARNRAAGSGPCAIDADEDGVRLLVIPTNEELEIGAQTLRCIQGRRQPVH